MTAPGLSPQFHRVAVIGLSQVAARRPETGPFGRLPASHAAAWAAYRNCDVVAVCDRRYDLLEDFRARWADTWPAIAGYTLAEQMLEEARPDVVSLCTPDDRHARLAGLAADVGVRGILCETPLATSLADADAMLAAAQRTGCVLLPYQPRRYDPLFHLVRETVQLGEIGELRRIRCDHTGPRPLLFRTGSQALDTLRFLADSPVAQVAARLEPGYEHWDQYRGDGGHRPESEPTASVALTFASGVEGEYNGVRSPRRAVSYELLGTDGRIRVAARHAELACDEVTRVLVPPPYDTVGLTAAAGDLLRLVETGGTALSPAIAARATVAVLEAALASHQAAGRPVAVDGGEEAT